MRQATRQARLGFTTLFLATGLGFGWCPRIAADDAPELPPPAPKPLEEIPRNVPAATADTVEFLADSLASADPLQRDAARRRLESASPERVRAVALELARRLVPKDVTVRLATSDVAVTSRIRYFDLGSEAARSLPGFDACAVQASPHVLAAKDVEQLLARAARGDGVQSVSGSDVTTYDGQRSTLQVMNKKAYIADYEVEKTSGGPVASPVIGNAVDGLSTDLRATVSSDKASVALALDFDFRQLVLPIAEEPFPFPGSPKPLVVQRPEIRGIRWSRTVTIPAGGTVLVTLPAGVGFDAASRDHVLALMVTCDPVTLDVPLGTPIQDFGGEDPFRTDPPASPPVEPLPKPGR